MQSTFKAFNFIQLIIGSHVYSSPPTTNSRDHYTCSVVCCSTKTIVHVKGSKNCHKVPSTWPLVYLTSTKSTNKSFNPLIPKI